MAKGSRPNSNHGILLFVGVGLVRKEGINCFMLFPPTLFLQHLFPTGGCRNLLDCLWRPCNGHGARGSMSVCGSGSRQVLLVAWNLYACSLNQSRFCVHFTYLFLDVLFLHKEISGQNDHNLSQRCFFLNEPPIFLFVMILFFP